MHLPFKQRLFYRLFFVAWFSVFANICFGAGPAPVPPLDTQLQELEELWKNGKKREYYQKASRIAQTMVKDYDDHSCNELAAKLLEDLLDRKGTVSETEVDDLSAMECLTSFLRFDRYASIEERRQYVRLLSRHLGKIREETVPNYKQKPCYMNVAPPEGTTPFALSGMDPKVIDDPVMRAKYEAAIRKNKENGLHNTRQATLRGCETCGVGLGVALYMIEVFRTEDSNSPLIAECIKTARLTDAERQRVEKAVPKSQTAPQEEKAFAKELETIKSLSAAGNTDAVIQRLETISQNLHKRNLPTIKWLTFVQKALSSVMRSPVGENEKIRSLIVNLGIYAVDLARADAFEDSKLLEQECKIVMNILPRANASHDQIARTILEFWEDLFQAIEHYSAYDLSNPKVKLEIQNIRFCRKRIRLTRHHHRQFRKKYADFLKKRNEFNRKASEYRALCDIRDLFWPKLQAIFESTYSGNPEKMSAGYRDIEKYVLDQTTREKLRKIIKSKEIVATNEKLSQTMLDLSQTLLDIDRFFLEYQKPLISADERQIRAKAICAIPQKALNQSNWVIEQTLQKCYDGSVYLSSYNVGKDRLAQCQNIIVRCLPYLDVVSTKLAIKIVGQMSPCYDLQGRPLTADSIPAYRNIYLREHLRVWERVAALPIDPTWDPDDMPYMNVPPPGNKYMAGISPESIKEPEIRKQYKARLEENRKKGERYSEQLGIRRIQENYLRDLKRYIVQAFEMRPMSTASQEDFETEDFETFKACLHIYVSDKNLRKELFKLAQTTVYKWKALEQMIGEENYVEAEKLAKYILQWVALEEDRQRTMLVYGRILLALGQKEPARRYLAMLSGKTMLYRKCKAEPIVIERQTAIYRAWLKSLDGKPDEAIEALEKILEEAGETPNTSVAEAADVLAMLYLDRGELDKAKKTVDFGLKVLQRQNIKSGYLFTLLHGRLK